MIERRGKFRSKIDFLLKKIKQPKIKKVYVTKDLLKKVPELKKFTATDSRILFKIFRAISYLAVLYIKFRKNEKNKTKSELFIVLLEVLNILINKLRAEEDG